MSPTSTPKVLVIGTMVVVCIVVGAVSFFAYQIRYGNDFEIKAVSQTRSGQPLPTESRMVYGTVEKISGQEIILKDFRKVPVAFPSESTRITVVINQATDIERVVLKDTATAKMSTTTPLTQPPSLFVRTKITLNDVKVGDSVMVFADEDISRLTTFTATKIEIPETPKIPVAVPLKK